MSRTLGIIAATSGFICVALGAFGAHGLKETLSPGMMDTWQTAVAYQFFHTLVLLMLALAPVATPPTPIHRAGLFFTAGILVFSGSLYALVLLDARWLGMVTPFGGVMLLMGWLVLLWGFVRSPPLR